MKKNLILAICVLAFLIAVVCGYKWIIEEIRKNKNVDDTPEPGTNNPGSSGSGSSGSGASGSGASGSSAPVPSKTNNDNPTAYGVGETLYTYGEYAIVREKPCVNNGIISNKIGEVKGIIGTITEVCDDLNGANHKWYRVKLSRPIESLFLEYKTAYVRDDVVTNKK